MNRPQIGTAAPHFSLPNQDGEIVNITDFIGKKHVVLYFYPKDDTPGCTKEACGFRDALPDLTARNAVVLGVSPDSSESHSRFREKYDLPFTLLADPEHTVAEKYGAWREKTLYGKKSMGIVRSTFVIDADGRVAKLFKHVRADGHAEKVVAAVDAITAG